MPRSTHALPRCLPALLLLVAPPLHGQEHESPHWAFVAPDRVDPPPVRDEAWPRGPLDRFVLARQEQEGISPSPEASRATLIRRLSLDLTGLPPTVDEVEAFEADERPDAYERVVDRLLASPHFGELEALEWLDLARYADTSGYLNDPERPMWKWRDWLVRSFNANKPFDRMTVEMLAGDLLPERTRCSTDVTWRGHSRSSNDFGTSVAEPCSSIVRASAWRACTSPRGNPRMRTGPRSR